MRQPVNIHQPQKLSLIAIIIGLLNSLRKLWAIGAVLLIQIVSKPEKLQKNKPDTIYFILGTLAVFVLVKFHSILKYFATRFFVNENNEFVFKSGLLNKTTTIIALEKIQSLQSKQSLLNRLSNTYAVKVETSGSEQAEVSLSAISEEQYWCLKNWVQTADASFLTIENNRVEAIENETPKAEVLRLTVNDFLRLCISENHLRTLVLIAAFIFGKLQEVKDFLGLKAEQVIDSGVETVGNGVNNILLVIVFLVVLTIIVSSLRLSFKYFNFQVQVAANKLHMQWGLVSTQQKTVAYSKIQMLSFSSNLVRRWLKLAILRIYTLGEEESKQNAHITLPISSKNQIQNITNLYQKDLVFDENSYLKIQKGYIANRLLIIGLPIALILSIPAIRYELFLIAFPIIWLIYFAISKYVFVKRFKAFVSENCLKVFQGVWGNKVFILKWHNIQGLTIKTAPFQRKNGLVNLVIKTTDAPIVLPYIALSKAQFLYNYALYKMETQPN